MDASAAAHMYTSMEVEYDSDEDQLQDVGNELTTWIAQLNNHANSSKVRPITGAAVSLVNLVISNFCYSNRNYCC